MRLHGATASHVGNLRDTNQDRVWFKGSVAALADGMGGHQGGERAAELAIGEFKIMPETLAPDELVDVVEEANRQVHKQSVNPELRGMGTTMVALGLHDNQLLVVNVGDSRAYRLRNGELDQITVDHSFVEELVRQGRLTPEEAAVHPQRNIVTRALGIGPEVDVDEFPIEPQTGDRFLLSSDGLFNEVSEVDILRILQDSVDPPSAAVALVEAALQTPCRDNVTVAVVDVVGDDFEVAEDYRPHQAVGSQDRDITAPVPIVAPEVVRITDRPGGGGGGRARTSGAVLERERVGVDGALDTAGNGHAYDYDEYQNRVAAIYADAENRSLGKRLLGALSALLVVGGLAAAVFFGVSWYASSSYFVGEVEDQLVIYQGQRGGFLWTSPELLEYRSGVSLESLTEESAATYESWGEFGSIDEARLAIESLTVMPEVEAGDTAGSDAAAGDSTGTAGGG